MIKFSLVPPARSTARYYLDPERHLRVEEYAGEVGLEEVRAVAQLAAADPEWSPKFNALVDFRSAVLDLSSNDVLRIALTWRQASYRSEGWTAFVVGSTSSFALVRMLSTWARMSDRMDVFRTREEAERWLDRKRRPAEKVGELLAQAG